MASGAFSGIDGKTALLLAPLATSTASLVFGWDQHLFLSLLAASPQGEAALPGYWRALFPRGVTQVFALLGATAGASAGAAWAHGALLRRRGALGWYAAAGLLALGHLAFVPAVAGRIKDMTEADTDAAADVNVGAEGTTTEKAEAETEAQDNKRGRPDVVRLQREWLRVNLVRTLTTDLGAWVCAFVAAIKTFS
ncbi:alpha glucosidase II [Purpureocillium lavendulum]|uniref:Alpha glucosidase II n=1 Tax=Purpureocillium lavendulum TaxID=1247861 RepID=A0AB34FHG2_9HYPO|nr:alpha glucosidase II [Purpureocillium lavendulum]